MNNEIKELIEEKAKNIYEKYYSNNPDFSLNEKTNLVNKISFILKKTLITPKRKRYLNNTSILPANDIFGSDSNIFFSPNFEESLKYLSPLSALDYFETSCLKDINISCADEHHIYQGNNGLIPDFTIKELSRLYKDFALFIEDNSESLIETGWPGYNFTDSAWLFYELAPNYPIEIPSYIKNLNRLKNPSCDPYFVLKKYFLNKTNQSGKCKYKMVSLSKKFSYKELGFIEDMRYQFLCLKKTILNEINQSLFLEITDKDLWFKNCLKTVFSNFSQNDLVNILCIEEKYDEIKFYNHTVNGGITNLLENIVSLYKECKFRKTTLGKSMINSILKGSKFNDQKKIISRYQIVQLVKDFYESNPYDKRIIKLINEFDKIEKEEKKYQQIIYDTLVSSAEEFLKVNYLLKPKHYPFIDNLIKSIEEGGNIGLNLTFLSQFPTPSQKRITPLELPLGTKWGLMVLKLIDNESIEITGPKDYMEVVTFREMGFENRKKRGRPPTVLWDFLRALAHTKGTFSWDLLDVRTRNSKMIKDAMDNATKRKQLVNQKLKAFFNLKEDSITYDRKNKIYETAFTITSENELF